MPKIYRLSIFFGIYSLISGIWHSYQTSLVLKQSAYQLNFINIIKAIGAIGYLIAGIGIFKRQKWAGYIFVILMVYLGYQGVLATTDFVYRLKLGHIFTVWYEIFVALFLTCYFVLPILSIWNFIIRKKP